VRRARASLHPRPAGRGTRGGAARARASPSLTAPVIPSCLPRAMSGMMAVQPRKHSLEFTTIMKRRSVLTHSASLAALATLPAHVLAQGRKDSIVLAMTLEPSPGLDPTGGAASSIAEITLYNIYETLTKINPDGSV